jgi:hypothetical protein
VRTPRPARFPFGKWDSFRTKILTETGLKAALPLENQGKIGRLRVIARDKKFVNDKCMAKRTLKQY